MKLYRGTKAEVLVTFQDARGTLYDPSVVRIFAESPSTLMSLSWTRLGVGTYRTEVEFGEKGTWTIRVEGEGPLRAVSEEVVHVL